MGVLWETTEDGQHYSVRSAGDSVRLYTNGVFHTQWNPSRPFAGAIWDCLSLPALYKNPNDINRILLLGLGGGAVVRQLQTLASFSTLDAIEIDPVHIKIAKQWFGVTHKNINVRHADAIKWVKNNSGQQYDIIIDDLFGHDEGEPLRAQPLTQAWIRALRHSLTPAGILIVNCVSRAELMSALNGFYKQGFLHAYRWSLPEYDNVIGVFCQQPITARQWTNHLEQTALSPAMKRAAKWVIRRPLN